MYQKDLRTIAQALDCQTYGVLTACPTGVAIDSRAVQPGDLFIALGGTQTDGHRYLAKALEAGACGIVISDQSYLADLPKTTGVIVADDGTIFLQNLAKWMRQQFTGPVVAITGSHGKTTTKDMLRAVLATTYQVVATAANQNNELGLPLTITRLTEETDVLLVEMGMRGLGEIAFLADIAQPTHGIITGIGLAHIDLLGTQANIAQAKTELLPYLQPDGLLVICQRDQAILAPHLPMSLAPWQTCGPIDTGADVFYKDVVANPTMTCYTYLDQQDQFAVQLPFCGQHFVENSLLVITMARALGISQAEISRGLAQVEMSAMRMEACPLPGGGLLLNDAYNANPISMAASLDVLATYAPRQRIAVLGDMYELGRHTQQAHLDIGAQVGQLGLEVLVAVGTFAQYLADGACAAGMSPEAITVAPDPLAAADALRTYLPGAPVILLKASRGMQLEKIQQQLLL